MRHFKLISLVLLGFILYGCATGQLAWSPEQREAITTNVFQGGYDSVFTAVVNTFESRGFAVTTLDKDNGIISTDYRSAKSAIMGSGKSKISARLSKIDEGSTMVKLNLHCEGYSDMLGIHVTDDLISEKEYRALFDAIKSRLNE